MMFVHLGRDRADAGRRCIGIPADVRSGIAKHSANRWAPGLLARSQEPSASASVVGSRLIVVSNLEKRADQILSRMTCGPDGFSQGQGDM
jgi:hypothetical protein